MANEALEARLHRLESALARRDPELLDGDSRTLGQLIADDFLELGASGRTWRAADVRATLANEAPRDVPMAEFAVMRLAPTVALVTYESRDPRHARRSSLWIRRNRRWQMVFHQGTLVAE
jgi:glyoxylase I family protein